MQKLVRVLAVVAIAILAGCAPKAGSASAPRSVRCESVRHYSPEQSVLIYPAKVSPAHEARLSFRVAGVIDQIVAVEGQQLNAGDVVARLDMRDYQLQLDATEAEYNAARSEVERVVALHETQSVSENEYDKAVNGLKMITAKLASHRNALEDCELRVPFAGYMQRVIFDRGESVAAGMPLLSIVSSDEVEVVVNIPANTYITMKNLRSASLTIDLYPDVEFPLETVGATPKSNRNQLFELRLRVEAVDGVLPPLGVSARVGFVIEPEESGESLVVVPFAAIVESENKSSVWVVDQGVVGRREVSVREITREGLAVVESGLRVGEVVVVAGVNSLNDADSVRVIAPVSKSNIGNIL